MVAKPMAQAICIQIEISEGVAGIPRCQTVVANPVGVIKSLGLVDHVTSFPIPLESSES